MSGVETRQYNIEKGEYSYSGPITQLFCVVHDFYPEANTFYLEDDQVADQEATDILFMAQDFGTKMFTTQSNAVKGYYGIGNGIKAVSNVNSNQISINFPFPQPSSIGICDFSKPAMFLRDKTSSCSTLLDLSVESNCEGV